MSAPAVNRAFSSSVSSARAFSRSKVPEEPVSPECEAIARAVANAPKLILADEPTGNLDSKTTKLVMELFEECNRSGTTVIIATHDDDIYSGSNHRVLELHSGRILPEEDRSLSALHTR